MVELNNREAFNSGAELWLTAPLEQSKWARKLDWYLNLQLLKADLRKPHSLPQELTPLLQEVNIPHLPTLTPQAPLMIAIQLHLPAKQLVVVPYKSSKAWIKQVHQIWQDLKNPSMRVFLPNDCSALEFHNEWPHANEHSSISLVIANPDF